MQLSLHSEYSLRVLLYLATTSKPIVSTSDISQAYGISKHHLVRVVQTLAEHEYVRVSAGRLGGIALATDPKNVKLGDVVRRAEPNFRMAECFDKPKNTCIITPVCSLKPVLREALDSFLATLDRYTLADLLADGAGKRMESRLVSIGESAR